MDRDHYVIVYERVGDDATREASIAFNEADAFGIMQYDTVDYIVYFNLAEKTVRDVSVDLAEKWWALIAGTFDPDEDELPDFIRRHARPDLDELRVDIAEARQHHREIASPYWSGRI